jgi:hypothetical protein
MSLLGIFMLIVAIGAQLFKSLHDRVDANRSL